MKNPYLMFGVNLIVGLIIMYFVMFAMIAGWSDFYNNVNMAYMAVMMAAPMGTLMLVTMPGMYPSRRLNLALHALFLLAFLGAFAAIRWQVAIGDQQFIRSMIPHHSGAILMCDQADLEDGELRDLCGRIIESQSQEIEQMQAILDRL